MHLCYSYATNTCMYNFVLLVLNSEVDTGLQWVLAICTHSIGRGWFYQLFIYVYIYLIHTVPHVMFMLMAMVKPKVEVIKTCMGIILGWPSVYSEYL